MDYTPEQLAEMSGEAGYRIPRGLELNEVLLNGDGEIVKNADGSYSDKGGYFRKRILVGRKNRDEKPDEINLGNEVSIIFLKIRRKLVERGEKGKIVCSTNEHNHKNEAVTLYQEQPMPAVTGIASDLRTKFEKLRTVQVVYGLLLDGANEPELVRLIIKGASLGSEAKAANVVDFYHYLASFPKEEHVWEYVTALGSVREEGQKSYYAIDFKRGQQLDGDMQKLAIEKLAEVHSSCKALDEARAAKVVAADVPADNQSVDDLDDTSNTDEVNPDDIPF